MKFNTPLAVFLLSTTLICSGQGAAFANDNHPVVRTDKESIIRNTFGNCVRTKWDIAGDPCAPPPAAPAPRPMQKVEQPAPRREIGQEERTIYFGFDETSLSPESQQKLDSLANTLKSEKDVKEARVVGYADHIGSTAYNEKLSKKRATEVSNYIVSRGFVNARVADTRWLGESAPATSCDKKMKRPALIECLGKDRRVEVEIEYLK